MSKMKKTNAMRMLDQSKIPYQVHSYVKKDGKIDGISVAGKIGREPQCVFKTLIAQGASGNHYVFVIPVTGELDLKKAARASGEKKIQMIPVKEILKLTGYIRGGCSPIGMKKQYQTWIDKSAIGLGTVIISAGQIGLQIEIEPELLRALIDGEFFELTAQSLELI